MAYNPAWNEYDRDYGRNKTDEEEAAEQERFEQQLREMNEMNARRRAEKNLQRRTANRNHEQRVLKHTLNHSEPSRLSRLLETSNMQKIFPGWKNNRNKNRRNTNRRSISRSRSRSRSPHKPSRNRTITTVRKRANQPKQ